MSDRLIQRMANAAGLTVAVAILIFLIVPTVLVIPMAFSQTDYLVFPPVGFTLKWFNAYLADDAWMKATYFSLKVAFLSAACATAIGTIAALAVIRGAIPLKGLITGVLMAPLIVPHIIMAVGVYQSFSEWRLAGTTLGFVLAHTVLAIPFVFIIVSGALQRVDPSYEMAALNLGASRAYAFRRVILPLIAPAVAASALFAFLSSFDETIVSFFISGIENKTITRKMFEELDFSLSPLLAAISTVFVVLTVGLTGLSKLIEASAKRKTASNS